MTFLGRLTLALITVLVVYTLSYWFDDCMAIAVTAGLVVLFGRR